MIPTFRPWTHTSDDSYIYQLSLVVATATVYFKTTRAGWQLARVVMVAEESSYWIWASATTSILRRRNEQLLARRLELGVGMFT